MYDTKRKNTKSQEAHTAARLHWYGAEMSVKHNKGNVEAPSIESFMYVK